MTLTDSQKDIISRATMAVIALGFGWLATWLLFFLIGIKSVSPKEGGDVRWTVGWLLIPVIVFFYAGMLVLGCFVFSARDPRKSDPGRAMYLVGKVGDGLSAVFYIFFRGY